MMAHLVLASGNNREHLGEPMPGIEAARICRLLNALRTDGDRRVYIVTQTTGFERIALALRKDGE